MWIISTTEAETGGTAAVRHLQLHPGASQYHPAESHRKRQDISGLRSGHGCGTAVLCGEIHLAPGSTGGVPDC